MICYKESSLVRIKFMFGYANTSPQYFSDEFICQDTCWVRALILHYAKYNCRLLVYGNSGYCKLPTVCLKPIEILAGL